ncbi:MAG TPA: metalloregulator ArsR/SmtB family transcription factor [Blastocatellia bacterium]|nr:metalloregulator ArsR/SmtB family transcription factor [Blastocatellia bacterium]
MARRSFFVALSDRTGLRILNLIGDDELCVCFFVEVLEENQPKISRHLAHLRRAGIVAPRREGKWKEFGRPFIEATASPSAQTLPGT